MTTKLGVALIVMAVIHGCTTLKAPCTPPMANTPNKALISNCGPTKPINGPHRH